MKRNAVLLLAFALLLLCVAWFTGRVPYHKWRLQACVQKAERLRAGEYTRIDAFVGIFGGDAKTYQDYEAAAVKHETTLIRLGYFVRKEFRLSNPLRTNAAIGRFLKDAARRFPDRRQWSALFSRTGDSVIITTTKEKMPDWEKFIADFDTAKRSERTSKCKRRWRSFNAINVRLF